MAFYMPSYLQYTSSYWFSMTVDKLLPTRGSNLLEDSYVGHYIESLDTNRGAFFFKKLFKNTFHSYNTYLSIINK